MRIFNKVLIAVLVLVFTLGPAGLVRAASTVNLGTASNFAVLAGSGITNTGTTTVTGDIGTYPTTTITGFSSIVLTGTNHAGDAVTQGAQTDLTAAYNNAAGQTGVVTVPTELGGTTKIAGAYDSAPGTFGITGTLTLDAQGDPNAVFIFKTASTLITAGASNVSLVNGAQACNVFWQVGSSATVGANSTFKGNILALTSATLTTGANVEGRVLARNGVVTMDTNTITKANCAALSPTPTSTPLPTTTAVPTISPTATTAPTFTATATLIPTLTATPAPTITPTSTAVPSPTATLVPALTATPTPTPTQAPIVIGVPSTGGSSGQASHTLWTVLMGSAVLVGIGLIAAFAVRRRVSSR